MLLSSFKFYCYKRRVTFKDVYKLWSEDYFDGIAESTRRTWRSAYMHCESLYDLKFREIKVWDLEKTIRDADVGEPTKVRMKCLFNKLYNYAIKHELTNKNIAEYCDTPTAIKKIERHPFSEEEIKLLWENIDVPFVDMVLAGIYLGFRPGELVLIKSKDVNLDEGFIKGGIKTKAGKNRFVPIHDDVFEIVENRLKMGKEYLFCKETGECMNYYEYRNRFNKVMSLLGMEHFPHDTRHTFITLAKMCDVNEYVLKLIVGHAIQDITEGVYTHRKKEEFYEEISKIRV